MGSFNCRKTVVTVNNLPASPGTPSVAVRVNLTVEVLAAIGGMVRNFFKGFPNAQREGASRRVIFLLIKSLITNSFYQSSLDIK